MFEILEANFCLDTSSFILLVFSPFRVNTMSPWTSDFVKRVAADNIGSNFTKFIPYQTKSKSGHELHNFMFLVAKLIHMFLSVNFCVKSVKIPQTYL